jgi:hypothetical protein
MKNLLTTSSDYSLREILQPIHFLSVAAKAYSYFQVGGCVLNVLMGMVRIVVVWSWLLNVLSLPVHIGVRATRVSLSI